MNTHKHLCTRAHNKHIYFTWIFTRTGGPGINRLDVAKKLSAKQDDTVVISAGQLLRSAVSNGKMAPDVSRIMEPFIIIDVQQNAILA